MKQLHHRFLAHLNIVLAPAQALTASREARIEELSVLSWFIVIKEEITAVSIP
jgi:hypothetical protein